MLILITILVFVVENECSYFIHLLCFKYHSMSSLILYIVKSFKQQVSKNEADCIWRRQTELTTAETLIMLISVQKCPQYFQMDNSIVC